MFRLPQKVLPPWALALERARNEFESLRPIPEGKLREVAGWLLVEQVRNDLSMDGIKLPRQRVIDILLHRTAIQSDEEQLARRYADAIQHLSQFVASAVEARQPAELTVELLSSLHRTAVGESAADSGGFRRNAINPLYPDHTPCLPEELPLMLHLTLEWFSAESINEMMPVEQATLVHVRLNDLQPFPKTENRVIRLATSLYTLRAGLPPLIITEDLINEYYQALLAGLQMATQPLIELFARCLCATLDNMKRLAENS